MKPPNRGLPARLVILLLILIIEQCCNATHLRFQTRTTFRSENADISTIPSQTTKYGAIPFSAPYRAENTEILQWHFQKKFERFLLREGESEESPARSDDSAHSTAMSAPQGHFLLHQFMNQSLYSLFTNYEEFSLRRAQEENEQLRFAYFELMRVFDEQNNTRNCTCDKEKLCAPPPVDFADPVLYFKLLTSVFLMTLSALFSGLTLGLLGLDLNSLSIVAKSDPNPKWRVYAKKIIPLRRNGNLLLCTLLLGNVMVNSAFSILTSDLTSGLVGFLVSSALIVICGEIIPQATCSRYALPIGANTLPIVLVFIFLLFPIAYPLSVLLDLVLGQELGTLYNNEGLKELIMLHAQSKGTELVYDSVNIMQGAIDFSAKTVSNIMTKLDRCFMLEVQQKLDTDTLTACWQSGHSRIPVYDGTMDNIVGVLFCKDLILLNPDDEIPLRTVLTFYGREALRVFEDTHLNTVLSMFKTGRSHMAIVQKVVYPEFGDPTYKTIGLVTLEDVVEEILQTEIIDETDEYFSNEDSDKMVRRRTNINMFANRTKTQRLTPKQVIAVSSYLAQSSKYFQMLPEDVLQQLLGKSIVVSCKKGDNVPVYKKGERSDAFTLVLTGKVEVLSGEDKFQTEIGPWSFVGLRALTVPRFYPDFDARVTGDTQFLQIKRDDYKQAVLGTIDSEETFYLPPELKWINTTFERSKVGAPVNGPAKSSPSPQSNGSTDAPEVPLLSAPPTRHKSPPPATHRLNNGVKLATNSISKSISMRDVAQASSTKKFGSLYQLLDESGSEPYTDPPPPKSGDKKKYTPL